MMQRNVTRLFFGGFTSGFAKGFSGQSGSTGGSSNSTGSSGGFGSFSSGGNPFPGFPGGGGGPMGGLLDKALEWCSESHARDIARDIGIDLRDLKFEKTAEGGMRVMVDAPNATPLQIEELGRRVQEECPVARFRKTQVQSPRQEMKWVQLPRTYDR